MPIVDIELLEDVSPVPVSHGQVVELANELGELFASSTGGTWVKLHTIPRSGYAENGVRDLSTTRPVFVRILKATLPPSSQLETEATSVCRIVARVLDRPLENTHVVFEPPAAGRIAFGGKLRREKR